MRKFSFGEEGRFLLFKVELNCDKHRRKAAELSMAMLTKLTELYHLVSDTYWPSYAFYKMNNN